MRIHPTPKNTNIMLSYDIVSGLSDASLLDRRQKKLRRLPHIFAKVLELPFNSDTDVFVEETSDSFRFVVGGADNTDVGDDITAHLIEIYHGVTKLVITDHNRTFDISEKAAAAIGGLMELDMWRFRLPPSTRPELATADYSNGELVVIVPKDSGSNNNIGEEQVWAEGGTGRLVLAQ
ncbi:uncharacterized protein LOC124937809 [Impatiens glandulifera]|uniref:uncharacterized protein LOC124937809 n=1 Tax=Impatiens glandulifera TaxID=253017 RepID=UPI001FB0F79C|nr:uncharacterized protein LOC124937809 [Impatiens glandulifera]